jgi:hypothetical protein
LHGQHPNQKSNPVLSCLSIFAVPVKRLISAGAQTYVPSPVIVAREHTINDSQSRRDATQDDDDDGEQLKIAPAPASTSSSKTPSSASTSSNASATTKSSKLSFDDDDDDDGGANVFAARKAAECVEHAFMICVISFQMFGVFLSDAFLSWSFACSPGKNESSGRGLRRPTTRWTRQPRRHHLTLQQNRTRTPKTRIPTSTPAVGTHFAVTWH